MDTDDSQAPKGSLRKFLEHLSGAGKAVGVLTRGEDAQDLRGREGPGSGDSGTSAVPRRGLWVSPALQCGSGSPGGTRVWVHDAGAPGGHLTLKSRRWWRLRAPGPGCTCVERRGWRISSRFGTAHCTRMEREWAPALGPGDLPFALERSGRHGCCMLGRCQRRPARRERLRDARPVVSMRPGPDIRTLRAPRASSAASLGPAPPPPRDTPVAAPGPAPQPAPQRPGKCSGVSFLVKGPQHQRSSCRVGFSEKEKVMQQRMGLEKLGE
ncbi:uncharacterized protein [Chlorocebus sabaeus]|uniref:uncharacterized protein isoform X2 n=1 Tax=Chlorocebus sabaeus TaxID=60711 RepID=UPI003BF9A635